MSSTSAVDTSIQTVSAALDSADCAIIASEAGRGIWTTAGCLPDLAHPIPARPLRQAIRASFARTNRHSDAREARLCNSVAEVLQCKQFFSRSSHHTDGRVPRLDGESLDLFVKACHERSPGRHATQLPSRGLEPGAVWHDRS